MIHLKDMRQAVDDHYEALLAMTDEELLDDLPNQVRMLVVHLERLHRNLAVYIDGMG